VERRAVSLRIKSLDDKGTFVGLGAVYGNVDLGNDVIDPGAFTRTLSAGKSFPVLWQHDPSNPIGTAKITDTREGLQVNGTLMLTDPTAQKAYTFMQAGVVKGLSIGFDTIQSTMDGDIRHLTELRLWEISCVTFPMNESAQVSSVKAMSDDERAKHLKAINECRKCIDMKQREMKMHLKAVLGGDDWDDGDDEGDLTDNPALLEDNEDQDDPEDEGMSMLVSDLKAFAEQAEQLASA
jgi:HK97 family phage prohead protease